MIKISIIIPAFNEEKNLEQAVNGLCLLLDKNNMMNDCEILIFNDKSTDKTGEIADNLAKEISNIRVIHNEKNMGFGYNYRKGVEIAQGEYVMMIPGDNEIETETIWKLIELIGEADIVISYPSNAEVRSLFRRIISFVYVKFLNFLFNLKLRYFNGINIHRVSLARKAIPTTFGFAYAAEMVITLLKSGASYTESPIKIKPITNKSSAFKLKNIVSVVKTILSLFWRINIKKERIKIY